jgi:hypothetical protein
MLGAIRVPLLPPRATAAWCLLKYLDLMLTVKCTYCFISLSLARTVAWAKWSKYMSVCFWELESSQVPSPASQNNTTNLLYQYLARLDMFKEFSQMRDPLWRQPYRRPCKSQTSSLIHARSCTISASAQYGQIAIRACSQRVSTQCVSSLWVWVQCNTGFLLWSVLVLFVNTQYSVLQKISVLETNLWKVS